MHHSESRYGSYAKYRETISGNGDWRSYKLFTDAGLNTKGNAYYSEAQYQSPDNILEEDKYTAENNPDEVSDKVHDF